MAALQSIARNHLDIANFPAYKNLLSQGTVIERYYLARVLATSRAKATYGDLLILVGDSHPNVVCQAYYALGQRRQKTAIPLIVNTIKQSAHWYTQWYGYNALKA